MSYLMQLPSAATVTSLPPEMIEKVFSYLDLREVKTMRCVSHKFCEVATQFLNLSFKKIGRYAEYLIAAFEQRIGSLEPSEAAIDFLGRCCVLEVVQSEYLVLMNLCGFYIDVGYLVFIDVDILKSFRRIFQLVVEQRQGSLQLGLELHRLFEMSNIFMYKLRDLPARNVVQDCTMVLDCCMKSDKLEHVHVSPDLCPIVLFKYKLREISTLWMMQDAKITHDDDLEKFTFVLEMLTLTVQKSNRSFIKDKWKNFCIQFVQKPVNFHPFEIAPSSGYNLSKTVETNVKNSFLDVTIQIQFPPIMIPVERNGDDLALQCLLQQAKGYLLALNGKQLPKDCCILYNIVNMKEYFGLPSTLEEDNHQWSVAHGFNKRTIENSVTTQDHKKTKFF